MKLKIWKKALNYTLASAVSVGLMLGLLPCMSVTANAANDILLTTITWYYDTEIKTKYEPSGIATWDFDTNQTYVYDAEGTIYCMSDASVPITISASTEEYTITKVIFWDYDSTNTYGNPLTDNIAPFTCYLHNSQRSLNEDMSDSSGSSIAKIDVYGSRTPSVSITPNTEQSIYVDDIVPLTATVSPEDANASPDDVTDKTVKWSVGGTDAGAVKLYTDEDCTTEVGTAATSTLTVYAKGISEGSATVTATSNLTDTKFATCAFTVTQNPDQVAADAVIAKIAAIGTVQYTDACKAKMDEARTAYDALTDDQKIRVTNYSTLTVAESKYDRLKGTAEVDAVIAMIDAIGTVEFSDACKVKIEEARIAYDALTDDQKEKVTNYITLTDAEVYIVIIMIDTIGTAEYTDACKDKLDEARKAYDALTDAQKEKVTNYSAFTDAENKYAELKKEAEVIPAKPAPEIKPGDEIKDQAGGETGYVVTDANRANLEVEYKGCAADRKAKKLTIADEVRDAEGNVYRVTSIRKDALKNAKGSTLVIGKNIRKIGKRALKGAKYKKIIIKTKKNAKIKIDKKAFTVKNNNCIIKIKGAKGKYKKNIIKKITKQVPEGVRVQ